jgi:hypothetical protein
LSFVGSHSDRSRGSHFCHAVMSKSEAATRTAVISSVDFREVDLMR